MYPARRSVRLTASESFTTNHTASISTAQKRAAPNDEEHGSTNTDIGLQTPKTPKRNTKKVRFSNAGDSPSNTGLTPYVNRATLSPSRSPSARGVRRSSDEPLGLPTPPSTISTRRTEVEIRQFSPLRQTLEPRQHRRLRRNRLSETQNEVVSEERARSQQVKRLELEVERLTWENEVTRQNGIQVTNEEEQNAQHARDHLAQALQTENEAIAHRTVPPTQVGEDTEIDLQFDEYAGNDHDWDDGMDVQMSSSPCQHLSFSDHPMTLGRLDFTAKPNTNAAVQTSDLHRAHDSQLQEPSSDVEAIKATIDALSRSETDARTALSTLHTVLTNLGFIPSEGDEDITATLQTAFRTVRLALESLLPGETVCDTTNGRALLDELIGHIRRRLVQQSQDASALHASDTSRTSLQKHFDITLAEKGNLSEQLNYVSGHRDQIIHRISELENELETAQQEARTHKRELKQQERVHTSQLTDLTIEKDAELTTAHTQIQHLTTSAAEDRRKYERQTEALNQTRAEAGELEATIQEKDVDIAARDAEIQALTTTAAEQSRSADRQREAWVRTMEENKVMEQSIMTVERERDEAVRKLGLAESRAEQAERRVEEAERQVEEAEQQVQLRERAVEALVEGLMKRNEKVAELQNNVDDAEASLVEKNEELAALRVMLVKKAEELVMLGRPGLVNVTHRAHAGRRSGEEATAVAAVETLPEHVDAEGDLDEDPCEGVAA